MGANKRLHSEYGRSGWNLSGFRLDDRPTWRRLLPEGKATPPRRATEEEVEPLSTLTPPERRPKRFRRRRRRRKAGGLMGVVGTYNPPAVECACPPFVPDLPEPEPVAPAFYEAVIPARDPATVQKELFA